MVRILRTYGYDVLDALLPHIRLSVGDGAQLGHWKNSWCKED